MKKKKIVFLLGIRPDIIRASLILKLLKQIQTVKTVFVWSGQHYSDNLKDIFFRELEVPKPDIELGCKGETDAEIAASVISNMYQLLQKEKPDVAIFLGDNNTDLGCIAAAQLNIPIIHIEGCMRSYDWRLPEEKYRILVDHLSDVVYTYMDEYKKQGIREGLNPQNIVVVGNPIVDILDTYYFKKRDKFNKLATREFFINKRIASRKYYLMTCHRRENVHDEYSLKNILNMVSESPYKVYFVASYRTQKVIRDSKIQYPQNMLISDPLGYEEFLTLFVNSRGIITDSGTEVEEACILQIPSIQMRTSTERPEVYEVESSVKFDPTKPEKYPPALIFKKIEKLFGTQWKHQFGDGNTSKRIVEDLTSRLISNRINGHQVENSHISTERSYREDEIKVQK